MSQCVEVARARGWGWMKAGSLAPLGAEGTGHKYNSVSGVRPGAHSSHKEEASDAASALTRPGQQRQEIPRYRRSMEAAPRLFSGSQGCPSDEAEVGSALVARNRHSQ